MKESDYMGINRKKLTNQKRKMCCEGKLTLNVPVLMNLHQDFRMVLKNHDRTTKVM